MIGLFNGHFVDAKALFALEFDEVCNISFIGEIDTSKAFALLIERLDNEIVSTHQHSYYDHGEKKLCFNNTIFVLSDRRMIELGNNYCQVLHLSSHYQWTVELINDLARFRVTGNESAIGFARPTMAN